MDIMSSLMNQVLDVASNQFLSGGLILVLIGAVGMALRRLPNSLWSLLLRYFTVIVDVSSNTQAYDWLLYWIESQQYSKRSRRISVKHIRMKDGEYKTVLVPSKGTHWFLYNYRLLWLSRNIDKEAIGAPGSMSEVISSLDPRELLSIRVIGRSREIINCLVTEAKDLYEKSDKGLLHISHYQWGRWQKSSRMRRPLDSIFLPATANNLITDIKRFVDALDWYRRMGIPYRRGYLFTGPPGTGKSASAEAIAGELELPIYVLNLAGLVDQSLEQAVMSMDHMGTAILLIEDVDTVSINRNTGPSQKISLGTLLNVLDGVQAIDNIILIMTSNKPEGLDPALTRKGRVDRVVEFGLASEEQINMAVKRFIPQTTLEQCREIATWPRPLSMAEVQEHLKTMVLDKPAESV